MMHGVYGFYRERNRGREVLGSIMVLIGVGVTGAIVSRLLYKRSLTASLVELGIKLNYNGELASEEAAQKAMERRALEEDKPFKFHPRRYRSNAEIDSFEGVEIISFRSTEHPVGTVLFLHGGTYVNEVTDFHLDFCDRMCRETGADVIVPLYPLAPNHTYEETYALLKKLYPMLREKETNLTLMGDSAGGGLAIAWCQYMVKNGGRQPDHLIAISPWLDVSMSASDYSEYLPLDPMLELPGIIDMGRVWAGGLDTKNYLVSPFYGDPEGLPETDLFVGTRELMYPDVEKFYEILKDAGVEVTLHVGTGMNHVYPIYPLVPESMMAAQTIFRILSSRPGQ